MTNLTNLIKSSFSPLRWAALFILISLSFNVFAQIDCSNRPVWDPNVVYAIPTEVQYNGKAYRNKWWTTNENPEQTGEWGVWEYQGDCIPVDNLPPTANLTAPANGSTATVGDVITLTAIADDTDGQVTQVEFFEGTTSIAILTAPTYTTTFTATSAGSLSFKAVATDNLNATGESQVAIVTVSSPDNIFPTCELTSPLNGASYSVGEIIPVTANADDIDGQVAKVDFFAGQTLIASIATPPYSTQYTATAVGNIEFKAIATDNLAAETSSAPALVTITPGNNVPPTVSISAPVDGATYYEGDTITISATAGDTDGQVTQVEFFAGTLSLGIDATSPYTIDWNSMPAGTFDLKAIATDNGGASTESNIIPLVVNTQQTGNNLTLGNLPLQINFNQGTVETYTFDAPITEVLSRNAGVTGIQISGNQMTLTGLKAGRTGLKIVSNGESYFMGLRINHSDGSLPYLPKHLSVGSVSEDSFADLNFWKDMDVDLTNKSMDIRYIYINGGPVRGWRTWGPERVKVFARESLRMGLIPFFVYYNIPDDAEDFNRDLQHVNDVNYMTAYFEDLNIFMDHAQEILQGELYGIVLEPDFLGYMQQQAEAALGSNNPNLIETCVSATAIAPKAGSITSLVERINATINARRSQGHNIFFGWQLNLWAYAPTSGPRGVLRRTDDDDLGWTAGRAAIKEGGEQTTLYGINAGILSNGANFISIDKYGLDAGISNPDDPHNSTWFFNNDHWLNYLYYVERMNAISNMPIVLWQLPVGHINSSTTTSAYTGTAFPDLVNTAGKYEDSTTDFFFGDVFNPGLAARVSHFSENKYNDPKLQVAGNQITWGSHFEEAKNSGVIIALFGAGVGASTDGIGDPPTDDYFWVQKVQTYYQNGPIPLDKEYGPGDTWGGSDFWPWLSVSNPVDGQEIIQATLSNIPIVAKAGDFDGVITNFEVKIGTQVFTPAPVGDTYTLDWMPATYGPYTIIISATDNDLHVTADTLNVLVKEFDPTSCPADPWDPTIVYNSPDSVFHNNNLWRAKWWTKGDEPGTQEYGPWENLGVCNFPKAATKENFAAGLSAYPNPFSDRISFIFELLEDKHVSLKVYNATGAEVETLVDSHQDKGTKAFHFNTESLDAGIYFYQLQVGSSIQSGTMIKK